MEFHNKRLDVLRWYRFNSKTITDTCRRAEFQRRTFEQFLMLFAALANDLRELKGIRAELERPYWQPLELPTFIEKEPENPDDPELGARG